jgi:hypothetical protein
VESMNLYGISIDKFKRTLKLFLAEFFYKNPYFFIHDTILYGLKFGDSDIAYKMIHEKKDLIGKQIK